MVARISLILVGVLLGTMFSEVATRLYLAYFWSPTVVASGVDEVSIFDRHKWVFDQDYGYRYAPDLVYNQALIRNGVVQSCRVALATDQNGNPGHPQTGDIEVALFGDSWSAFYVNGKTLADALSASLEKRIGRSVAVTNFARGGSGLVEMVEWANLHLSEGAYDLAVLAFITDDLDRARHWQIPATVNGEQRALVSIEASSEPNLRTMVDAYIVDERATPEWCRSTIGDRDEVVVSAERKYRRFVATAAPALKRDALRVLDRIFLWERLSTGEWFEGRPPLLRPASLPRIDEDDLGRVSGFSKEASKLTSQEEPLVLVHIPTPSEVKGGSRLSLSPRHRSLWESLVREIGQPVIETLPAIHSGEVDAGKMAFSETNPHPSLYGMAIYADAIAEEIEKRQLLLP